MDEDTHRLPDAAPLRVIEIIVVTITTLVFLALVFLAIRWRGHPVSMYVRDPAATFGFSPVAGMISHIGVFALLATAAICIFCFWHAQRERALLFCAGLLSLTIALDDFFMIHEEIAPHKLGIPEVYVFTVYGLLGISIYLAFRASLTGLAHVGLYASLSLLAASVGVDVMVEYSEKEVVLEDSLKFLGLVLWASYWIRRANLAVAARPSPHLKQAANTLRLQSTESSG